MEPRIEYTKVAPQAYRAMAGLESYVRHSGLDEKLLELVRLRASQINGCAFCIDMHTKDARVAGETEQRLYAVSVWNETPFYTDRERAALAWTEALTLISETHAPDEAYAAVRAHFSEEEVVILSMAIVAINGWNRLALGFRTVPGTYEPSRPARAAVKPQESPA
jgi:AhpD family alkylhydroperoxidase